MKIRGDFITNSSSASFVLQSRVIGFLPYRKLEELMIQIKLSAKEDPEYRIIENVVVKEDSIKFSINDNTNEFMDAIQSDVIMNKGETYDTDDNIISLYQVNISSNVTIHGSEDDTPLKFHSEIIQKLSELCNSDKPVEFFYLQEVSDFSGDGWSVMDAPEYEITKVDLLFRETKKAKITTDPKKGNVEWEIL